MDESLIRSLENPLVKHCVKLRTSSRYRREQKELLLVGRKVVSETEPRQVLLIEGVEGEGTRVSEAVMRKITGLTTPDGVAAILPLPEWSLPKQLKRLLILDGVSDPGNLGTLMRSALAFGWEAVVLTDECCDPYNEKAFRASRGAALRLPHWRMSWQELDQQLAEWGLQKVVADLEGEAPEKCSQPIALVLGSEGSGPSASALENAQRVTLPMVDQMESLNVAVAGGILLYLMRGNG